MTQMCSDTLERLVYLKLGGQGFTLPTRFRVGRSRFAPCTPCQQPNLPHSAIKLCLPSFAPPLHPPQLPPTADVVTEPSGADGFNLSPIPPQPECVSTAYSRRPWAASTRVGPSCPPALMECGGQRLAPPLSSSYQRPGSPFTAILRARRRLAQGSQASSPGCGAADSSDNRRMLRQLPTQRCL